MNGRMVPLRHKLHSGDIVEILTQPGHKPSRDWLAIVKSSRSRNKIKHWLNIHQRERAIEIGRKLVEKRSAANIAVPLKELKDEEFQRIASDYGLGRPDDLMAGIGYGKYSARQVLAKLTPAANQSLTESEAREPESTVNSVSAPGFWRRQQRHHGERVRETCWSTARDVATRFAAKGSSAT